MRERKGHKQKNSSKKNCYICTLSDVQIYKPNRVRRNETENKNLIAHEINHAD